ncbi:MAG TPA: MBL fold metallo-hydrolase [Terracidiphilus sp.]|jgi:phosphoribosyl 1,2-cyclic phosphodiesterase|nr:MBL fold metallo-hydrolase [Terracidiphilus sp.]
MNVTFWGVRGGIPTPEPGNLQFGGDTACVTIEAEGRRIVLDAGTGIRQLGNEVLHRHATSAVSEDILLSHFHWDHIQGIPYFAPLFQKGEIRFYAHAPAERIHAHLAAQMAEPFFPWPLDAATANKEFRPIQWHKPFEIGPFHIVPFPLHHPQQCTGFRIQSGGRTVVYATDHEHGNAETDAFLLDYAMGADILIADAQYTPEEYTQHIGWGHTTWLEAAKLAERAKVGRLVLFHHDPLRDDDAMGEVVESARKVFASTEAARERATITAEGIVHHGIAG